MEKEYKPIRNVLTDWVTLNEYGDIRISGKAKIDQDGVVANGQYMITSPIISIKTFNGIRYLETKNSRYILED